MMKLIKLRITLLCTILAVFGLFGVNQASAIAGYSATTAELSLLPAFCQAKLGTNPADHQLYSGKIGPNWLHIHHYCVGLNFINRYKRSFGNKGDQQFYLQSALSEFEYMFTHSSPTFWMRPEMHVQKGKLLASAKRTVEAVNEFEMALKDNPNYLEAHVALSDLYKNTGQKSKSITALEQALQLSPNNKSLQRRYNELTGKVFTPPPPTTVEQITPPPPTPIPVEQAAAASEVDSTTTQPVPASSPAPVSSPAVVPEKIGTPSNPYCRFCPPEE